MSKTLTLEIPDEIFDGFEKQAESKGKTAETYVLEIVLKNFPKPNGKLSEQKKNDALADLMRFSGAVNSGNSRSGDNEQIDADLAREYSKDL